MLNATTQELKDTSDAASAAVAASVAVKGPSSSSSSSLAAAAVALCRPITENKSPLNCKLFVLCPVLRRLSVGSEIWTALLEQHRALHP